VNDEELHELWARWLGGETLTEEESATFTRVIGDPATGRMLLEDQRLDRVLAGLRRGIDEDRFVRSVLDRYGLEDDGARFASLVDRRLGATKPRAWGRPALVGLVAGLGLGVVIGALVTGWLTSRATPEQAGRAAPPRTRGPIALAGRELTPPPDVAPGPVVAEVRGRVFVTGKDGRGPVSAEAPLDPGALIEAEPHSHAVVALGAGAELAITGPAVVTNPGARADGATELALGRGTVVATTSQPTAFTTPLALVRVAGVVDLRVDGAATWIKVRAGATDVVRYADGARASVGQGEALVVRATGALQARARRGEILFVVGNESLNDGEAQIRDRLEDQGFSVTPADDERTTAAEATGKALVMISSSATSTDLDPAWREAPVPVMTWEGWFYDELGMTFAGDSHPIAGQVELTVRNPHPLAAGLSGPVKVVHAPVTMPWARPGPGAIKVASVAERPHLWLVFGYERGAAAQGVVAPARRLGFFLFDDTATALTTAGWALFDAAIAWCMGALP
jgi:hypothetical protein